MPDVVRNDPQTGQYTGPERRSRPRRSRPSSHGSLRRLRLLYFYLAALWGFAVGALGLGVSMSLMGHEVGLGIQVFAALVPFAGFALLGGAVASIAYREARRRR